MAAKQDKTPAWLLPGTIIGGLLLLIGGASSGDVKLVILAIAATAVLSWTITSRRKNDRS